MRKILIRFDDICPAMDWTQWMRAEALLNKYGIKPLIGIVPDCRDSDLIIGNERNDYWEYIRELQRKGYTIALHGFNHVYQTESRGIVGGSKHSEFAGLSCDLQYKMIEQGKKILNDNAIETDVFFAPAHSYDVNTLRALKRAGFKYISDGKSFKPYTEEGIRCMPCRSGGVPGFFFKEGNYTAVFHTTEWRRKNKDAYEKLARLCSKYKDSIVGFDEYCDQKDGFYLFQKTVEKANVFFQRHILPIMVRVKHMVWKL